MKRIFSGRQSTSSEEIKNTNPAEINIVSSSKVYPD